ncbi:MAG: translation initiation factor IF-2 [Candidatus Pacebacteria bacterium]|nr:translation initiation factor IF-2 [Candidatus Paceibacterota bacterium]
MDKQEENKNEEVKKISIEIEDAIVVKDLAAKMEIRVTDLIAELMKNKIFATLNEKIDFETAVIVGDDLGFEIVRKKSDLERNRYLLKSKTLGKGAKKRPPVVVVMGHVDHGKTTLLDKILSTNVAAGEHGGITQNVSSYQVKKKGEVITFMDTPGHEAFHSMRERGAYITDLAVIVVAADDGVKPQTKEAVAFAKSAGLPIIVAINKIDKPESNVELVKKELSDIDLMPEEWGGKTVCVNISAKTGEGIDNLLDMIILYSDMEELKAEYGSFAEGFIIESHLNPKVGPIATVLIQNGTLSEGDFVAAGILSGRIKIMKNFLGEEIEDATPSMPITILGLSEVPRSGMVLKAYPTRSAAEAAALAFKERTTSTLGEGKVLSVSRIQEMAENGKLKKLNLVIKADTKGSLEAIVQILDTIKVSGVAIQILKTGVGDITESDVKMAQSSDARVIGFNNSADANAKRIGEKENIAFKFFNIIYEMVTYVKGELSDMLDAETVRTDLGKMKVIAIFKLPRKSAKVVDMIFGAKIEHGKVEKNAKLEIMRDGEKVGEGILTELQHNKKTVGELKSGNNAGVTFKGDILVEEGDDIVAYKEEKVKRIVK